MLPLFLKDVVSFILMNDAPQELYCVQNVNKYAKTGTNHRTEIFEIISEMNFFLFFSVFNTFYLDSCIIYLSWTYQNNAENNMLHGRTMK